MNNYAALRDCFVDQDTLKLILVSEHPRMSPETAVSNLKTRAGGECNIHFELAYRLECIITRYFEGAEPPQHLRAIERVIGAKILALLQDDNERNWNHV